MCAEIKQVIQEHGQDIVKTFGKPMLEHWALFPDMQGETVFCLVSRHRITDDYSKKRCTLVLQRSFNSEIQDVLRRYYPPNSTKLVRQKQDGTYDTMLDEDGLPAFEPQN